MEAGAGPWSGTQVRSDRYLVAPIAACTGLGLLLCNVKRMEGGRKPNDRVGTPRRGKRSGEQRPASTLTAAVRVTDAQPE